MTYSNQNRKGFTLLETILGIAVLALVTLAIFALFQFVIQLAVENKARTTAAALATERLELARNLPYLDVGTVGGIPAGTIEPLEQINRNSIDFTVDTDIFYIDDVFDGTQGGTPDDALPNDYKRVRVEVRWPFRLRSKPVVLLTDVAPKGLETNEGGGTISLTVFDASGFGIPQADVSILNTSTNPIIDIDTQTSDDGIVLIPGAPASIQAYQITVGKTGYSQDQTHTADASLPTPDKPHLTVFEGVVTSASFSIDWLSDLSVNFQDVLSTPLGDIDFNLAGAKRIGLDGSGQPVLKYSESWQSGPTGSLAIANLEWDSYTITVAPATGWDIAETNPIQPLDLLPKTTANIVVTLEPNTPHSLLVIVEDVNNQPLDGATVHLTSTTPPIDETLTTSSSGQVFFTALPTASSTLEVSKTGFTTVNLDVSILDYVIQSVILSQP